MIVQPKQPLLFDFARRPPAHGAAERDNRALAVAIAALGFFCFLPYPALPIGNASAVQIGNILVLVMSVPFFLMPWNHRMLSVYPLILAPLFLSLLKVELVGESDLGLSLKSTSVWAISALGLVAAQLYAPRYALELLTGVALATILHAGVGIWQFFAFSSGVFPLSELYINPSFLSVQDNAENIARYNQRPFGLFPEPSAMSSSLAPWVLFWVAELCGLVRLRRVPATWQRGLFAAAAALGLGLIILSQSGHAAMTIAALALLAGAWFVRCRANAAAYLGVVAIFGAVAPVVIWFAATALGNRIGGSQLGNSSWEERARSLRIGFSLLVDGDVTQVVCGAGIGLISPALWNAARIDAVFSVLLTYIYETGLVGALVVVWIGQKLVKVWKSLQFNLVFATFAILWLAGITITTSYEQLLPLWIALGWLTAWPEFCSRRPEPRLLPAKLLLASHSTTSRQRKAPRIQKALPLRNHRWRDLEVTEGSMRQEAVSAGAGGGEAL